MRTLSYKNGMELSRHLEDRQGTWSQELLLQGLPLLGEGPFGKPERAAASILPERDALCGSPRTGARPGRDRTQRKAEEDA